MGNCRTYIDFFNVQEVTQLSHQLDELFLSQKEIETPLGMDDIKQRWKWDVAAQRADETLFSSPKKEAESSF